MEAYSSTLEEQGDSCCDPDFLKLCSEIDEFKQSIGFETPDEFGNLPSFHSFWEECTAQKTCCVNSPLRIHSLNNPFSDPLFYQSDPLDDVALLLKGKYEKYADLERDAIILIEKQLNQIVPTAMAMLRQQISQHSEANTAFQEAYIYSEAIARKSKCIFTPVTLQSVITHCHSICFPNGYDEQLTPEQRTLKYKSGCAPDSRLEMFRQFVSEFKKLSQKPEIFDLSLFYRIPIGAVLIPGLSQLLTHVGNIWPNNLINVLEWMLSLLYHSLSKARKEMIQAKLPQVVTALQTWITLISRDIKLVFGCLRVCYNPMFVHSKMIK